MPVLCRHPANPGRDSPFVHLDNFGRRIGALALYLEEDPFLQAMQHYMAAIAEPNCVTIVKRFSRELREGNFFERSERELALLAFRNAAHFQDGSRRDANSANLVSDFRPE